MKIPESSAGAAGGCERETFSTSDFAERICHERSRLRHERSHNRIENSASSLMREIRDVAKEAIRYLIVAKRNDHTVDSDVTKIAAMTLGTRSNNCEKLFYVR
jgi:hypothetical protein